MQHVQLEVEAGTRKLGEQEGLRPMPKDRGGLALGMVAAEVPLYVAAQQPPRARRHPLGQGRTTQWKNGFFKLNKM